jgi:hypothetical protein
MYVEAPEPRPNGAKPVTASAESVARRVRRPLPYKFSLPEELLLRSRLAASLLPPSPDSSVTRFAALRDVLEQRKRGEIVRVSRLDEADAALLRKARERFRQLSRTYAVGSFLADFDMARDQGLSPEARRAALERLVPGLRPDFVARQKRFYPAAERRCRKDLSTLTPSELLRHVVLAATVEAVATAKDSRDVYLGRLKFTHTTVGGPIVPAHVLRESDLLHVLKARVAQLVEEEFAPEITELEHRVAAETSLEAFLEVHPANPRADTGAAIEDAAPDWSDYQPTQDWGQPTDNPLGIRARYPTAGEIHFGSPLTEALAARGIYALDSLEAEDAIRPQREAKIAEVKALATPAQRRLIEAILETGGTSVDLAMHLRKTELAVRQLMFGLRAKVERANVAPPRWARPPQPSREIPGERDPLGRGGTVPPTAWTDPLPLPPWPCTLPTHGFSSSSNAEGFLKPRNGVPA